MFYVCSRFNYVHGISAKDRDKWKIARKHSKIGKRIWMEQTIETVVAADVVEMLAHGSGKRWDKCRHLLYGSREQWNEPCVPSSFHEFYLGATQKIDK